MLWDKVCINCGSKTHHTRDCTKDAVPKDRRPCFKCGKLGHQARACTEGGAHLAEVDVEDQVGMCLQYESDFQLVPKSRQTTRRVATLGDFMMATKNKFAQLANTNEDNQPEPADVPSQGEMTGKERRAVLIKKTMDESRMFKRRLQRGEVQG